MGSRVGTRHPWAQRFGPWAAPRSPVAPMAQLVADVGVLTTQALALPFDTLRALYARAAQVGLIRRSMLAQRDFERSVRSVERLALGPWARRL